MIITGFAAVFGFGNMLLMIATMDGLLPKNYGYSATLFFNGVFVLRLQANTLLLQVIVPY